MLTVDLYRTYAWRGGAGSWVAWFVVASQQAVCFFSVVGSAILAGESMQVWTGFHALSHIFPLMLP